MTLKSPSVVRLGGKVAIFHHTHNIKLVIYLSSALDEGMVGMKKNLAWLMLDAALQYNSQWIKCQEKVAMKPSMVIYKSSSQQQWRLFDIEWNEATNNQNVPIEKLLHCWIDGEEMWLCHFRSIDWWIL